MKKILIPAAMIGLLAACQPPGNGSSKELTERIEKLEKKVEALEKRGPAGPARPEPPPTQTAAYNIPIDGSPVMGKKDAKVSVTIFSDYQCPFCARVDPMLYDILKDPELKDKVNVVFKQFPLSFHQNARPASKAALAVRDVAGEEKFWDYSKKLFENQREFSPENYSKWAGELGVDVKKFEKALKDNDAKYEEIIKKESELGAKEAKVRGTPSIFVNGWELRQRSVDGVKQIIKEKNLG
jgi:protein-disulfide isomerase